MTRPGTFPVKDLEATFPEEEVKIVIDRNGNPLKDDRGNPIPYLETHTVTERLNQVFGGRWSFEIVKHEIGKSQLWVLGRLSAGGGTKEQFGSSEIKRKRETGEVIDIGNDLKAAASDALKKCASLMGVGLYLQDKGSRGQDQGSVPPNGAPVATGP